ncbi:hypothetical protein SLEP1_g54520 [Rubroshorea leprosula]|uniref:Uncharacterized protein n=1 Tax=Rubroshorea leprosula TaxID=152421 RepID=A0AAV5MDM3_9ROSI|nr:hypothetical protein SLEP1_g54520 [Rubroshorea leprosula]
MLQGWWMHQEHRDRKAKAASASASASGNACECICRSASPMRSVLWEIRLRRLERLWRNSTRLLNHVNTNNKTVFGMQPS